jgi:hypothetical protein
MSKNKKFIILFIFFTGAIWFSFEPAEELREISISDSKFEQIDRAVSSISVKDSMPAPKKRAKKLLPTIPISIFKNEQKLNHRRIPSSSKLIKNKEKSLISVGDHHVLDNYFAVPDSKDNRERFPKFESKLGYLLVKGEFRPADSLAVTQNKDSGALGIMTGVLTVKLYDFADYQNTIDHSNFTISEVYDHINVVHFKLDSSKLAISTYEALKVHPNVQRVKLEILEYSRFHR